MIVVVAVVVTTNLEGGLSTHDVDDEEPPFRPAELQSCWLAGLLTPQQHVNFSQERICSEICSYCLIASLA